jgi:hypothetical protein
LLRRLRLVKRAERVATGRKIWCSVKTMATRILRLLYALLLLGVALFAVFGFLATFEPSEQSMLPWRIGYAAVGVGAVIVALWLLMPRRGAEAAGGKAGKAR